MDRRAGGRWVVAILPVAAIVALVALARGEPEHAPRGVGAAGGRRSGLNGPFVQRRDT